MAAWKTKCSVDSCPKWSVIRGFCSAHSRQADGRIVRCVIESCRRRAAVTRKDNLCVYHACPHRRCGVPSCEKLKQWQSPFCINHTRLMGSSNITAPQFIAQSTVIDLPTSISLPDFFLDPASGMVLADAAKKHLNHLLFPQQEDQEQISAFDNLPSSSLPSQ